MANSSLDPDAKAFVDQIEAMGAPPSYTLPIDQARAMVEQGNEFMCAPGAEMASVTDMKVPGAAGQITARIYVPKGVSKPAPLMVFFHGGGFAYCSLNTHDSLARNIAAAGGCIVASVDYRMAPEHRFPAAYDDAVASTRWFMANAASIGGDPRQVVVGGDSAGGNLAAVVAQAVKGLVGQLLLYPVCDWDMERPSYRANANGFMLTRDSMMWFRDQYMPNAKDHTDPRAAPLRASSLAGLAPAYVLAVEFDPLRDEAKEYADKLAKAGVPTRYKHQPGQIHGFIMMNRIMRGAEAAVKDVGDWLKSLWH